ncbi:hypothetical protein NP233_g7816 [Leucocoprinus birnbaumii]|uniref:CENP-V/GFA domain-containing protein n=1 Tax=Leucocoprinus birnbaumii TaxID=56174 RepID=A0AAD5VTZ9_9AGAR|nr:hypothetical protein NP233_g7816 [Leucocoprinus birnbaumii]
MPSTGSCLCGQVIIELDLVPEHQYTCYCVDCKKTSGSAFATNFLAPKSKINITGPVKSYSSPAATGNIVTRYFCSNCGSSVAHDSSLVPDLQALQTGIFPDFANVKIGHECEWLSPVMLLSNFGSEEINVLSVFVKNRWPGLGPIAGAEQVDAMPGLDFIMRARDLDKTE